MVHRRQSFVVGVAGVAVASLIVAQAGLASAPVPQSPDRQVTPRGSCLDEAGAQYSPGALRKVSTQIQQCDIGHSAAWAFDPANPPADTNLVNGKSCRSTATADKGQEYGNGLLRSVGQKFERCDNGKWVPSPGRSGGGAEATERSGALPASRCSRVSRT
jgi:hypothetical protein